MAGAQTQVRPLPPDVRAKLNKLMPMLGSSNDGERASAAGMITALLKAHGLDWHDMVGAIGDPTPKVSPAKPSYGGTVPRVMTEAELKRVVHLIQRSRLSGRARRFLAGMLDKAELYGSVSFSDLQWMWFQDLAKRAGAL